MSLTFSTPGLEPYLVLAQEIMRHVYAEESPEEISQWILAQLQKLSGRGIEQARLLWEESFPLYEEILAKRKTESLLPENERN